MNSNKPTTIRRYGFVADIIHAPSQSSHVYHYLVQKEGEKAIVYWGQEDTHEHAIKCVEDFLGEYNTKLA